MLKLRNQELIILIVTIVIFAGFSVFLDKFFSTGNLLTLMRSVSILGILSIAMAVVVISKGIDLSLIATLALGTALASVLSSGDVLPSIDLPFIYAVILGFIFTAVLCAITGILVAYWDIASLFVTLAMAGVIYGLGRTLFIQDERNYLPEDAAWLEFLGRGQLFGVPMPIICFLILAIIMHLLLTKTTFGKFVYSIGDSGLAARTAGVPVRPILVMILLFPTIEKDNLFSYLSIIFLTFISFPVFLWGIDRGIIYNILLIILLCYLIYSLQLRMLICSIITLIASYLFFINLLGNEFEFFFNNSVNILKEINYIHGIIHPNPLSDDGNATRALKSLIAIIASFLICLNLFFTNDTKYLFLKKFLIVISISSILLYINALGRSDGPHIRTTFGLPIIFLSTYIFFNIIFFLEKRFNFIVDKKFFSISLVIVIIVVSTFAMNIRTNNILNFQDRFNYFISLEDNEYLNENYKKYISELKPIIENEVCIQLFTNSAIMPYLLKKKNCSKFYFVWSVGSEKIQNEMINEITDVNFILSDKTDDFNEFSPNYKLPLVKNYIDKNYYIYMSLDEFDLLKKNE